MPGKASTRQRTGSVINMTEAAKTAKWKRGGDKWEDKGEPLEWVAGAFIAGMVISKLLSRKD